MPNTINNLNNKLELWQNPDGTFTLKTHDNRLYWIYNMKGAKFLGVVGKNWIPTGKFLRSIPNHIKKLVFSLNKKPEESKAVETNKDVEQKQNPIPNKNHQNKPADKTGKGKQLDLF